MIYLDTHVVLWLYLPRPDLLSQRAAQAIEEHDLLISPVVLLELEYLRETERITADPTRISQDLGRTIGLSVCGLDFSRVVEAAQAQSWTRDPFDRLIVGHACGAGSGLITKDESIRTHYSQAIW